MRKPQELNDKSLPHNNSRSSSDFCNHQHIILNIQYILLHLIFHGATGYIPLFLPLQIEMLKINDNSYQKYTLRNETS